MTSLVDRVCEHGFVYCPLAGCHDKVAYKEDSSGMRLFLDLAEQIANEDLPYFYQGGDPWTGWDGPDEAVDAALIMLTIHNWPDKGEGWCQG